MAARASKNGRGWDSRRLLALNLILDLDARVLICSHRECGYALQHTGQRVTTHLGTKHQVPKADREGLTSYIHSLELPDPRQVPPREDGLEPYPHLIQQPGFVCRRCGEGRTISPKSIDSHVRSHGHRRGPRDWAQDDRRDRVILQSWVREGARQYWIARGDPAGIAGLDLSNAPSTQVSARLRELHGQERQRMADRQAAVVQAATENGSQDLSMVSPWMRRTRWVETYRGARRDLLVAMTEVPSNRSQRYGLSFGHHEGLELCSLAATERQLGQVMQAVDRLFDRYEETVRHTGQPILTWLQSQHPTVVARQPFRLVGRKATKYRYRRVLKRFFSFLIRLYEMDPKVRRSALNIELTESQRDAIGKGWNDRWWRESAEVEGDGLDHLGESGDEDLGDVTEGDDDDEDEEEEFGEDGKADEEFDKDGEKEDGFDERDDGDEDFENRTREYDETDRLAELILDMSIWFATEEFTDGQPSSSLLVYFSGILGLSEDGTTFRRARDYTPFLSALIHQQRLLFLEWALPYQAYPHLGRSARPRRGHLALLNKIRRRYMCFGCLTPICEFATLRAYGRKICRTDGTCIPGPVERRRRDSVFQRQLHADEAIPRVWPLPSR